MYCGAERPRARELLTINNSLIAGGGNSTNTQPRPIKIEMTIIYNNNQIKLPVLNHDQEDSKICDRLLLLLLVLMVSPALAASSLSL